MGLPAEGLEGIYRNRMESVASFLDKQHPGHYLIINLSQSSYDYSKFHNNVTSNLGFPDHHAPSLYHLFILCDIMRQYLDADPKNVVAVHCKV